MTIDQLLRQIPDRDFTQGATHPRNARNGAELCERDMKPVEQIQRQKHQENIPEPDRAEVAENHAPHATANKKPTPFERRRRERTLMASASRLDVSEFVFR